MDFSRFLNAAKAFFMAAWLGWWLKIPRLEFGDLVPPLSTEEFLRDHWGRHLGLEKDGFAAGMSPLRSLEVDVLFFFDGYQWCFGACLASPRKPFATSLGEDWCDNDLHLNHLNVAIGLQTCLPPRTNRTNRTCSRLSVLASLMGTWRNVCLWRSWCGFWTFTCPNRRFFNDLNVLGRQLPQGRFSWRKSWGESVFFLRQKGYT